METHLVLDLGGTAIKYALMDDTYHILEQSKTPSPLKDLDTLLITLENIGKQYSGRYQSVAISMPGRIDTKNGIAHTGGSFTFLHDCPFASEVEKRLGTPVTIANDGKCAANAELIGGALDHIDNGAVVVLGTGTGGGVVLNGKVWMGTTFGAGEFSTLPTNFENIHKGIYGFTDPNSASMWAMQASASGLIGNYMRLKGLSADQAVDGIGVFKAYDAGDPAAHEALKKLGRDVAAGIYSIQAVLDLQRFAIGGGISARSEVTDVIREALDAIFTTIPFTPFSKPEVVTCQYRNDANLIGALRFHLDQK